MISLKKIVNHAYEKGTAIPAFNIPYLPMMAPVIDAVKDCDSFALIECARLEWRKFAAQSLEAVTQEFASTADLDYVRLHLDHIPAVDEDDQVVDYLPVIKRAITSGYHSVMIDGSRLPLTDNLQATREVVALAHQAGIPCEAELGAVLGHEEGQLPPYEKLFISKRGFTDPKEARFFIKESGCDWLSVAVGTVHGAISKQARKEKKITARLDLEHLERLRDATEIPLVLHGGSGIDPEYLFGAFQLGVAKLNIGTDIRQAYENSMRTTGQVGKAQDAVYKRVCWLLRREYKLAGNRSAICLN